MGYNQFATFEFDPSKSKANLEKHGIDFIEAQKLWEHPVLRLLSKVPGELRELVIGQIGSKYWTAIITRREGAIRLISCRRSRDEEKKLYEKSTNNR
jgi:hypothetical protein